MPEGDTIRRLADKITRRFAGERCARCVTRDPRLVGLDLAGRTLVGAEAVGKHLLIRFDDGRTLHAHLRMDGSFDVGRASREPEWRRRVELWMETGRLTAVDVPILEVVPTAHEDAVVGHLGPDLCGAVAPDLDEVLERVVSDPARPIAGALLDQRNVAGFGNVYVVEIPFLFGVSPNQVVGSIDGLEPLLALGAALIRTNAARGPQNTTGRRLTVSDHWIYGRRRRPCPVCAATLDGWEEGESPWGRVSTWCPSCQQMKAQRRADVVRARRLVALHPARRDPHFPADVRHPEPRGSASSMTSSEGSHFRGTDPRLAGATDDETTEVESNAERMPTDAAAVRESADRADDLELRRTSEDREAGEPSGTTTTGPAAPD
jgi:endonuclease-8